MWLNDADDCGRSSRPMDLRQACIPDLTLFLRTSSFPPTPITAFASNNGLFISSSQRPRLNSPMSACQNLSATIERRKCSGDKVSRPRGCPHRWLRSSSKIPTNNIKWYCELYLYCHSHIVSLRPASLYSIILTLLTIRLKRPLVTPIPSKPPPLTLPLSQFYVLV